MLSDIKEVNMAFEGYLLKVGAYEIPMEFIAAKTYDVTRNVMELKAYRDANGTLHRNTVSHVPIKINFKTPARLSNQDIEAVLSNIRANYKSALERKASITCYVPEIDDYIKQDMYMPDITMPISEIDGTTVYYEAIKITFIGY